MPPPIWPLPTTPILRMSSEAPPEGNQLLIGEIRRAIERTGGRIPFRDYMELSLYHPLYGYYSVPGEKTGKRGDYLTSPHVSPLFGQCLARFIGSRPVLEIGPGDGTLAAQLAGSLEYTTLERNSPLPDRFEGTILRNELLDAL